MPKSIEEILEHADELAKVFEDYEPKEGDEINADDSLRRISKAVIGKAEAEAETRDAVVNARHEGHPWADIATFLGTSRQSARQRYKPYTDDVTYAIGDRVLKGDRSAIVVETGVIVQSMRHPGDMTDDGLFIKLDDGASMAVERRLIKPLTD